MSRRVVGIDPSLTRTGIAIVEDGLVLELWHRGSDSTGDTVRDRAERIETLAAQVTGDLFLHGVDAFVIEGPSHNSRFGKPHERAGLWWAIVSTLIRDHDAPIYEVAPQSRAKYATGKGNSKKPAVYAAVQETYGPVPNHDQGDALLLAAMGARVLGCPVEATEPAEGQLAALSALARQVAA